MRWQAIYWAWLRALRAQALQQGAQKGRPKPKARAGARRRSTAARTRTRTNATKGKKGTKAKALVKEALGRLDLPAVPADVQGSAPAEPPSLSFRVGVVVSAAAMLAVVAALFAVFRRAATTKLKD